MSDPVWPHRQQPTRLPRPWDSQGKNTGVGCHFPLQCVKVKTESEVAQSCSTRSDPKDCSLPGSSVHGIFQAGVLGVDKTPIYLINDTSILDWPLLLAVPLCSKSSSGEIFLYSHLLVLLGSANLSEEKEVTTHCSILAWRILWTEEPGGLLSMGSHTVGHDWSDLACMHALEKEMATHSCILAWRIPGTEEPGGLPSMGSHRVGHDWSDLVYMHAISVTCLITDMGTSFRSHQARVSKLANDRNPAQAGKDFLVCKAGRPREGGC